MTFTYHSSELASSTWAHHDRAVLRLTIGDTSTSRAYNLDDAEVDYYVASFNDQTMAAAQAAEALAAKYAESATSKKVGDLQIVRDEHTRLLALARDLSRQAASGCKPLVGGVSVADKESREANTDRVTPAFYRGRGDNPMAHQPGDGGNVGVNRWSS